MESYQTIKGAASAEVIEKKSRFIAHIEHVETEEEALKVLERIKAEHRMARHNVYAYLLKSSGRVRYSDDGEPQKTAGLPTLEALEHAGLSDVIMVTTRYFGGVLLGTGGLVRAYTQAAQAAISAADLVRISRCVSLRIVMPYSFYDKVNHLLSGADVKIEDASFAEMVTMKILILDDAKEPLLSSLEETLRGQASMDVSEVFDAEF